MDFIDLLEKRVLVLDGAMGTMIQTLRLREEDFRGERFTTHECKLSGCNDLLCITRPEAIRHIHATYLKAGADIISTNTFNANAVSMADYGLDNIPGLIREINREGARIAREAVEEASCRQQSCTRYVAGSIGPTNKTASMSPDVNDPALRNITYEQLFDAYTDQITGLTEGGVDLLLFETVFDTLNLKAGLDAANAVMRRTGHTLPIMISATVSDRAGRTLSGQTLRAFVTSVEDYDNVVSIGLNCSFGPGEIIPYLQELGRHTRHFVSCHPNAGLPNVMGEYDETPGKFAAHMRRILSGNLVNIAGGCCGTTPDHISALAAEAENAIPRRRPVIAPALRVSGLENVDILPENNFVNVGERCNVAGSRKFLRLIKEKNYEEAMRIAARQVEDGAMIIDINMDDALIDARHEMVHFLRYIASDPEIARVPVMVDSSQWEVVEAALKNIQGKSIVNSISLKEGEEIFINRGRRIRQLGAAVIVMAFDEEGQADTYERKIAICKRAYTLLTEKCGFKADDIIFDVNIMAVATGIEEHNRYGIDYIRAVEWIKNHLPGTRTSGGVSNLSFAFRGKNYLREAMHAVFLYHAIRNGLDMGIVNPASTVTYEDIDPQLRTLIEDVVLARRAEAPDELAAYAANDTATEARKSEEATGPDISIPVEERIKASIIRGDERFLNENLTEALAGNHAAVEIIEGPLMEGMNRVGQLFGEGKMFLPQVVKTARTMKRAVDYLRPFMEAGRSGNADRKSAGKVVFATVKGDVHDIGKNICSIVLACNNFEVIDLGVMVPAETIVNTVRDEKADLLCLSGLITPSLAEMVNVVKALNEAHISIPVLVGGATTSRLHTALRIAPVYGGVVVHVGDASQNPLVAAKLLNPATAPEFIALYRKEIEQTRSASGNSGNDRVTLEEARRRGEKNRTPGHTPLKPVTPLESPVIIDLKIKDIVPYINWRMLFHAWKMTGKFLDNFPYDLCEGCIAAWESGLTDSERAKAHETLAIYKDALRVLHDTDSSGKFDGKGTVTFFNAFTVADTLVIGGKAFPLLRQQGKASQCRSISDWIARKGENEDYTGVFAVTAGNYLATEANRLRTTGDEYGALLRQSVADRIAEAASEWMHAHVRRRLWGYAPDENLSPSELFHGEYSGIRPAIGYPMLPDQLLNIQLSELLDMDAIGVKLTENGAMIPSASVSGIYIANPAARYFIIGEPGYDQLSDYAARRGVTEHRIKEILRVREATE
ncbi:MAG: methionine synthase [Bacteroidales bacterium]|nr:methionine synthase [Bacteroidales bacterium]